MGLEVELPLIMRAQGLPENSLLMVELAEVKLVGQEPSISHRTRLTKR